MQTNYFKLLLNRLLNKIGNVTYDYANSVWMASMGAIGQKYLGLYQLTESLISIIFNPIAGAVADKVQRKRIVLFADLLSAVTCLLVACINNEHLMMAAIIFANIILAIAYSFSGPAIKSMIPNALKKDKILSFNSTLETSLQVFSVVSPLLSYFIYSNFGLKAALIVNGVCFFISFLLILTVRENEAADMAKTLPTDLPEVNLEVNSEVKPEMNLQVNSQVDIELEEQAGGVDKHSLKSLFSDIRDGLHYIKADAELIELLVVSACVNFFMSIYNFLIPFSNNIFQNDDALAALMTFGACGSIGGAFIAKYFPNTRVVLLGLIGFSGLGLIAISVPKLTSWPLFIAYVGNFIFMLFNTTYNIHFVTRIQAKVDDAFLGRVFSTVFTIAIIFMPVGTSIITLIPTAVSSHTYIVIGACLTILAISALILHSRQHLSRGQSQ